MQISDIRHLLALTPLLLGLAFIAQRGADSASTHLRLYDPFLAGLCPQPAYADTIYLVRPHQPLTSSFVLSLNIRNSNQGQPDINLSFAKMRNTMEANRKVWFITGKFA